MSKSTNSLQLNGRFQIEKMATSDYLKWSADNNITLPAFQRGQVWSANDMMALLTTIKNGEPMPTIVVAEVNGRAYLLDGQQRTNSFKTLLSKFTGPQKFEATLEAIRSYEVAIMRVAFDDIKAANDLYNRLNAKSGLTVGQKTKGQVHDTFRPLYNYIQGHHVIKAAYTKASKSKIDDDYSIEATIEKTEDITNALAVATVMPSIWSTQTAALAKILASEWKAEKIMEAYFDEVDGRLQVVADVLTLRPDIAARIKSNKAVFVITYLMAGSYEAHVISQALRVIFDGQTVVPISRDVLIDDKNGRAVVPVRSIDLFGSGSSNDGNSSRQKEALIRCLCDEAKATMKSKPAKGLTADEMARLSGLQ